MSKLLSVKQLAEQLGKSETTIWRYTRKGILPAPLRTEEGQFIGYVSSEIINWLKKH